MIYSQDNRKTHWLLYFAYSLIILLFCYGFSPLIRFYSTDSSVFYCMGKAMDHGIAAYRDFFDHKGLWIYFFNWFGVCLDRYFPGFGMYLVEVLFSLVNLLVVDRILALFTESAFARSVSTCLFFALSLNYFTYSGGNYTETYALTFQIISVFLICRYYLSGTVKHPSAWMLVHGFCSGVCFMLRANLAALWVPFGVALAVKLFRNKEVVCFFKNLAALVLGLVLAFAPPLVYCVANDCLREMLFCTFTFNLSYVNSGGSVQGLIRDILLSGNSIVIYPALISAIIVLRSRRISLEMKLLFVFGFLFVTMVTFMGMRAYGHYFQTFLLFTIPLFVWISEKLEKVQNRRRLPKAASCAAILLCAAAALVLNMRLGIRYLPVDTEYKHLYGLLDQAAQYIESDPEKDTFMSTMNFMQAYVITDTVPTVRYPYIPGVDYESFPDPFDEMYKEIISGNHKYLFGGNYQDGDWFIFGNKREYQSEINRFIQENYRVVLWDETYHYVLFEKKEM